MSLTLVILAAGMSTRYGRLKQLEPIGPSGEALLDYGICDAMRAGFERFVVVIRPELEGAVRDHCTDWWPSLSWALAHQTLDQLPAGVRPPSDRVKPWGTAHAVLAAAELVDGPCAVCNADDFYGAGAYVALARHLREAGTRHAAVGYRLEATLSPHGGVSRGLFEVDGDRVRRVTELADLRWEGAVLRGRAADGRPRAVGGEVPVSMNLWGFRPDIFPLLRAAFTGFLAGAGPATGGEFLLSSVVGDLVAAGRAELQLLRTTERWMGVTHPGDRDEVAARLRALVADGRYPSDLRRLP